MTGPVHSFVVGEDDDAISYYVRGGPDHGAEPRPPLLLVGSPMDASGFGTLAGHFEDRPVITMDPRGAGRNPTGTSPVSPERHAEDLHRVVTASGVGPVDVFASSGGAVNALAMAARHPEQLRRLVAHEPPTVALLPDRDAVYAALADIGDSYRTGGQGPAMARFIALIMFRGEVDADYLARPAPDPAAFGLPTEDDGNRTNPMLRNMPACNAFVPDAPALARLGDRLVIGVGAESGDELAARGGRSVAALLGRDPVEFPGGHNGFLGGEFGQTGEPEAFAARLREALG